VRGRPIRSLVAEDRSAAGVHDRTGRAAAWACENLLYDVLKAGLADGRLRRPSSADSATVGSRPASLALNASQVMALAVKRADIPNQGRPGGVAQAPGRRSRSVEARSQSDALVGCIVWLTTASNSADSVSRSISSRRRALNAAIVWAAS
jgi:hypothetical protein